MSIKQILLLVSTATLFFSGSAFAQNSYLTSTWGVYGTIVSFTTDGTAGNSKVVVDVKPISYYKSGATSYPEGCAGLTSPLYAKVAISNSGYTATGSVQQQRQDMMKNMILLAKSTGAKVSFDVGPNCELFDLRLY